MIKTKKIIMAKGNLLFLRVIAAVLGMIFVVMIPSALGAGQPETVQNELPQPEIPKPQFFCGYCHILTYPDVVKKGYDLWKKGKHKEVGCVECHYPPKKVESSSGSGPANTKTDSTKAHIPKAPPERFSYVKLGGETVLTRPKIVDASCMTAKCHGNPKDEFKTKKIQFTEKVVFTHKPHFEEKNKIEGMKLNCVSCHQHETEEKKFEVTKQSCHLCHFSNVKFNEGRGKCETCHALPEKPIQTSGEKPITHQMLKDAKVSCTSCHLDVIQAAGGGQYEAFFEDGVLKTALVLGAGRTKKESCLACHNQAKALKEDHNKKLMHEKHVTVKNARCFDCHRPIQHAKAALEGIDETQPQAKALNHEKIGYSQPLRESCAACHPDPHRYQRLLSAGPKRGEVSKTPDFMYKARTGCLGCHNEMKKTEKGEKVLTASGKTCVRCHTKDHDKMLTDWKTELVKELKDVKEVEVEALEALAEHKPKLTPEKLAKANEMLQQGRDDLNIVQFGNGVHNKKYSIMLIDAAITSFEDLIDFLEEGG